MRLAMPIPGFIVPDIFIYLWLDSIIIEIVAFNRPDQQELLFVRNSLSSAMFVFIKSFLAEQIIQTKHGEMTSRNLLYFKFGSLLDLYFSSHQLSDAMVWKLSLFKLIQCSKSDCYMWCVCMLVHFVCSQYSKKLIIFSACLIFY